MVDFVKDERGKIFAKLPGGGYQELSEQEAKAASQGALESFGRSAAETVNQGLLGAVILNPLSGAFDKKLAREELSRSRGQTEAMAIGSPIATMGGQMAPGAALGAATWGAGVIPTIATEAGLGAVLNPENPMLGAAIGAGTAGVARGVVPAVGLARGGIDRLMGRFGGQGVAQGADVVLPPGMRPAGSFTQALDAPSTPASRIAGVIDAEDARPIPLFGEAGPTSPIGGRPGAPAAGGVRLQGLHTPEELRQMGVPLTYGDTLALRAGAGDDAAWGAATRARNIEELQRGGILGGSTNTIRAQQKAALTGRIQDTLGLDRGVALTDDVIAKKFVQMGQQFDDLAAKAGVIPTREILPEVREILSNATGPHAGQLKGIVDDLEKMGRGDGNISGQQWQVLRTRLGKMVDAGQRQGDFAKLSDAMEMQRVMQEAIEGGLSVQDKTAAQVLRRDYALTSALARPGVRAPDTYDVNAGAMKAIWDQGKKKQLGQGDISKMLATARFLQTRVVPTSGTSERLMANWPQAAATAALGASGLSGVAGLLR